MRRLLLAFAALSLLLGALTGCHCVGGVCDCYGYGCYPQCYSLCGPGCSNCGAHGDGVHGPSVDGPTVIPVAPGGAAPAPGKNNVLPSPMPTPAKSKL